MIDDEKDKFETQRSHSSDQNLTSDQSKVRSKDFSNQQILNFRSNSNIQSTLLSRGRALKLCNVWHAAVFGTSEESDLDKPKSTRSEDPHVIILDANE